MKRTKLIFVLLILVKPALSLSQSNQGKFRQQILRYNNVDTTYKFINSNDSTEIYLRYLGKIRTVKGSVFKVMTSTYIWGLSCRATNRMLFFNGKDQYIGNYYVTTTYDLPDKIENNEVIFLNKDKECDLTIMTRLNFDRGLPKQFFRKCKGNMGDIYSFSSSE